MFLKWLMYAAIFPFTADHVHSQAISRHKRSDDVIPCDKGWYYFRDKCYIVRGKTAAERCNWETAVQRCIDLGGSLVSIHSQEEHDFLTAFLILHVKSTTWIGLNDRVQESEYVWQDGSIVNYTNWRKGEPYEGAKNHEDCTEMALIPELYPIGQWNDARCDLNFEYICEKKIYNRNKSINPKYCDDGGIKFFSSCYHLVKEVKSWDDAEQHCIDSYNGHLVTIYDVPRAKFLDYILSDFKQDVWIGIKIRDQHQQIWTSGWYVGYSGLDKETYDFIEGICVIRRKLKEWSRVLCAKKHAFICEKSTIRPPVQKLAAEGSYCPQIPQVWSDLAGEYCYFVEKEQNKNWYEANFECMRKGGHLLSLHSKEEIETLHSLILYTRISLFIGLFRSDVPNTGNQFKWVDESPMDYENWGPGRPQKDKRNCGEIFTYALDWNTVGCKEKRGYVCSVKKISPNSTEVVEDSNTCPSSIRLEVIIGIVVCLILVIILIGVMIYYFRRKNINCRKAKIAVLTRGYPLEVYERRYTSSEVTVKEDDDEVYEIMD